MDLNIQNHTHKRYNILTGEWILVSPHRSKRPWQGQQEDDITSEKSNYDKNCYLCTGNKRANGEINPNYKDVFVFTNDFAALEEESKLFSLKDGLLQAEGEQGICKVVCFSADHSKSLAQMPVKAIQKVVHAWQQEFKSLSRKENINYIQIFENKGAIMGCSNPHPHGQIWSQFTLPNEILKKDIQQLNYFVTNNKTLLGDYIQQEIKQQERIIFENRAFIIVVPFWAIWPFETIIIPKKAERDISYLSQEDTLLFAEAIMVLTKAYDNLFNCSFPYSSGIHQAPTNGENNEHWHWHMSFYPPLLRSATVKKFMVGYEMFAGPQRDITPESAANTLKNLLNRY
jgi:UDPglucose--hexose-1-phosphate uridylyltransferase